MDNKKIIDYFLNEIYRSKDPIISKVELVEFAKSLGMDVKSKTTKSDIFDWITENNFFDQLYEKLKDRVLVPSWDVGDHYGLTGEEINELQRIGVIKEVPQVKEFYSRKYKEDFEANVYPLEIFNYSKEELKAKFKNAYGGEVHSLRIETKKKEDLQPIVEVLERSFKLVSDPKTYDHRNDLGQYTYFKIKLLNNTEEESNALLLEIQKLKQEIKKVKQEKDQLREEKNKKLDDIVDILEKYLGDGINMLNLESRLEKLKNGGL
jgi:hypothetical protein